MMNDKELLELAAKAAGIEIDWQSPFVAIGDFAQVPYNGETGDNWNPLTDDGDALRLAVKLNLNIEYDSCQEGVIVFVYGNWDGSPDSVTETFEGEASFSSVRRAIVRAAAEIGKELP